MSASSTHSILARAFTLLDKATTEDGCRAALAEAVAGVAPDSEVARFLAHRGHLICRGGERTLVREALSARDADIRAFGEERADSFDPPLRLYRCATTRPDDDGRLRTIETGGSQAAGVQLSADGERIYTFVNGRQWVIEFEDDVEAVDEEDPSPEEDAALFARLEVAPRASYYDEEDEGEAKRRKRAKKRLGAARFQIWRTATGERIAEVRLGKFYDEEGCFAVSPDERALAVRRHHDFEIYALPELAGWARGERPRHRYRIACGKGPEELRFLDEHRLLARSSEELSLWDIRTGERLAVTKATGSVAVLPGGGPLVMGGFPPANGASLNLCSLPGLEPLGACSVPGRNVSCSELAISPGQTWLATKHASYPRGPDGRVDRKSTRYTIHLWPLAELRRALATGSSAAPSALEPRELATVGVAVSCLCFVSESRLLSGHNDGSIIDWRFGDDGQISSRPVVCHDVIVSGIAVHPNGRAAVSAGWDGNLVLLDLESRSANPSRQIPRARKSTEIRRHAAGIEVVIDDVVQALIPLPGDLALEAPLSAEVRPKLALAPGEDLGGRDMEDPPRLSVWGGAPPRCTDLIEVAEPHGHLLAVDARTVAIRLDDHIEFYRLR